MRPFSRRLKLGEVRRAAEALLQAPARLSCDWALNVHAAYPAVEDFARVVGRRSDDLSDDMLAAWAHSLADKTVATASVRGAAWTIEVIRHRGIDSRSRFRNEFSVLPGEEPLADFAPHDADGDEFRIGRLGLEVLLRSAGQFDTTDKYTNIGAIAAWRGSLSSYLVAYTNVVNPFCEDGQAAEVLRYITD